ncbi:TraX family protein [Trichococcus ilyis]|uniref:Trax n=1 Tax=Trichococcus ilyis TaxID=640938 RepID=A0A143Z6P6_9LACT|nr:TraX family protein [Trichococcus ilyis]CZR05104.1 trax [Trichococcus ilyis]SEJ44679.1 TraX protein [Trichococcus ilyis]
MGYSNKTALIKWIAVITMTIDHIGYYLFPSFLFLRVIGRIAFPCFLYTTVKGVRETRDFRKYLLRLILTGVISMPITAQAGNAFNILFTLALFALSIKDCRLIVPAVFLVRFTEYGLYGFLMGWTIYLLSEKHFWAGVTLFLLVNALQFPSLQVFAALALIPMLAPVTIVVRPLPKWAGYAYYPIHQAVLMLLARLM